MKDLDFNKSFEIELTSNGSTRKVQWAKTFSEKPFIVIFQPGAGQKAASKNMEAWMAAGLGGCTNEAKEYGNQFKAFSDLQMNIFIVNTMSAEEQQKAVVAKEFNKDLMFISDFDMRLADLLGVKYKLVNDVVVHEPTIGIYSKTGKCLQTVLPEHLGSVNAKRCPATDVLQMCKNIFTPSQVNPSQYVETNSLRFSSM